MSTTTADTRTASPDTSGRSAGTFVMDAYRFVRANPWTTLTAAPVLIAALAVLTFQAITAEGLNTFEAEALALPLLQRQLTQHVTMTAYSTAMVVALAIPLGILLTRPSARRIKETVLSIASGGQAIPAYGLLVLFLLLMGRGFATAVWALTLYSILPVLRNTMVGLEQVDDKVIEAARGMGLTKRQVLRRIELPLAVPVILAGVRTALIINVGTAALATFIGGGGLGETINTGLKLQQDFILLIGSGMTALLALTVDWVAAVIEHVASPKGLK